MIQISMWLITVNTWNFQSLTTSITWNFKSLKRLSREISNHWPLVSHDFHVIHILCIVDTNNPAKDVTSMFLKIQPDTRMETFYLGVLPWCVLWRFHCSNVVSVGLNWTMHFTASMKMWLIMTVAKTKYWFNCHMNWRYSTLEW